MKQEGRFGLSRKPLRLNAAIPGFFGEEHGGALRI